MWVNSISSINHFIFFNYSFIFSKLSNVVHIVKSFVIPISLDLFITSLNFQVKVHDLNDSENQSFFFSIFLNKISILLISFPAFKYCVAIDSKLYH